MMLTQFAYLFSSVCTAVGRREKLPGRDYTLSARSLGPGVSSWAKHHLAGRASGVDRP